MADPIVEDSVVTQSIPPVEAPASNGNNGNETAVTSNLGELDAVLNKAFGREEVEPKVKTNEKIPNEKPKGNEPVAKVDAKTENPKASPEAELPNPDSLDSTPAKKQEGWNALRNNYKKAHKIVAERDEEIKRLKSGLAEKSTTTSKEVEGLKNEIKELSRYRTMIDIQADPEFMSKFDQPLEKATSYIKEMLIGMQVSKEVADQIDFNNTKLMDEIAGYIEEHRDKFQSKKFQRKVEEVLDLMDKRQETLQGHSKNYNEFMEAKKKESSMKGAENEGRMIKHLETIAAAKDKEGHSMFPFLNKMTPAEGAAQGEVDQATNHNNLVDVMQKKVNEAIKYDQPEQIAELAVAAVASHYLKAQLMAVLKENTSLKAEIAKISNLGTDTERSKPRNPTGRNGSSPPVDLDSALETHFSR